MDRRRTLTGLREDSVPQYLELFLGLDRLVSRERVYDLIDEFGRVHGAEYSKKSRKNNFHSLHFPTLSATLVVADF